jgi:hypothetical protein
VRGKGWVWDLEKYFVGQRDQRDSESFGKFLKYVKIQAGEEGGNFDEETRTLKMRSLQHPPLPYRL